MKKKAICYDFGFEPVPEASKSPLPPFKEGLKVSAILKSPFGKGRFRGI